MMTLLLFAVLIAGILLAVHHAEVVAHRVGEPFGTLILAVCVTAIETALIISIMISKGPGSELIARDAIYAAVMIVVNGIVGLSILVGGIRHHEMAFRIQGSNAALTVLAALSTLTLVLPNFTTSIAGPFYTEGQLAFAGLCSIALYGTFVFVQTVRHRDYFLPVQEQTDGQSAVQKHAPAPTMRRTAISAVVLVISLVLVVYLAKLLSPTIQQGVEAIGAPKTLVGILIAAIVLAPESIAAVRAAIANRLQTSFNLALGSALASIGLTIPAVAVVAIILDLPLNLGLDSSSMILLLLTFICGLSTLATGKTAVLHGMVHLVIFLAYLFLTLVP